MSFIALVLVSFAAASLRGVPSPRTTGNAIGRTGSEVPAALANPFKYLPAGRAPRPQNDDAILRSSGRMRRKPGLDCSFGLKLINALCHFPSVRAWATPNIAAIYAVEESSDGKAPVMELVKGETLKIWVSAITRRQPWPEEAEIAGTSRQLSEFVDCNAD